MARHNMKVFTGKTNAKFAFEQIVVASLRNTPPPDFSEQSIFEKLAGSPADDLVFLGHKKNSQSYGKRRRAQRWCHAYALVFPSSRPSCRVVYHTLEKKFKMMQNTYSLNINIMQWSGQLKKKYFFQ